MPLPDELKGNRLVLRFGAGLNVQRSELEINDIECADGRNFDLNLENSEFRRRKPFDLAGTVPNSAPVNGFAQLQKSDGSHTTLVQGGSLVYKWEGGSTFTEVGSVATGAKLRGPPTSNWPLDDIAIIADLAQKQPVMTWDGTIFAEMSHNLGGQFFARYCLVENERAWFANVKSGTATPHVVCASKRGDNNTLTITNRPSSSLADGDPFIVLAPDFRPINGLVGAFGTMNFSTERGRFYTLTGTSEQNFAINELYADSGAAGQEAIAFIGNDIAYGRAGKIETLFATQSLGDVETDDLSREIRDLVKDVDDWTVLYDSRLSRIYFFAPQRSRMLVFHKPFIDERIRSVIQRREPANLSPWSLWTTEHAMEFRPTAAMVLRRPQDGDIVTYLGGQNGEIFQLEGAGGQDGGTEDIIAERLSKAFEAPDFSKIFEVTGWLVYRRYFPATVTITFEFGGLSLFDQSITVNLAEADNIPVYGGDQYYNNDLFYSTPFKSRLTRNPISVAGIAEQFQVRVKVEGATDFFIHELGLEFKTA